MLHDGCLGSNWALLHKTHCSLPCCRTASLFCITHTRHVHCIGWQPLRTAQPQKFCFACHSCCATVLSKRVTVPAWCCSGISLTLVAGLAPSSLSNTHQSAQRNGCACCTPKPCCPFCQPAQKKQICRQAKRKDSTWQCCQLAHRHGLLIKACPLRGSLRA